MRIGMSKKYLARLILLSGAVVVAGCGGTVAFQGKEALSVTGTPPPPAPPPPAPAPPPPPAPPPRVEVRDNKIEIHEKIQFAVNKATILEASFSLLDEIASVIKGAPHIKKIAIEGHASAEGNKAVNLKLSDDRAKSVMKYLTDKGIEKDRLTAKGFGSSKPIADNDTEEGREKNRRVEFNIVEQDVTEKKVQIDTTTGKEKVLEERKSVEKKDEAPAATDAGDKKTTDKKADKKAADKKAAPTTTLKPPVKSDSAPAMSASPKAPVPPPAPATSAK